MEIGLVGGPVMPPILSSGPSTVVRPKTQVHEIDRCVHMSVCVCVCREAKS